jgi:hypothetical protein
LPQRSSTPVATKLTTTWTSQTIEIDYLGDRHSIIASQTGWWLFIAPATNDPDTVPRWLGQRW